MKAHAALAAPIGPLAGCALGNAQFATPTSSRRAQRPLAAKNIDLAPNTTASTSMGFYGRG